MVASISLNPFVTTVGNAGLFNIKSDGYRQGTAMPDPSTRYRLRQGVLSQNETLVMWGGVGVYAFVPGGGLTYYNTSQPLGTVVGRATALTGTYALRGFSVFDEDYAMVIDPQNTVPRIGSGAQVNWYPLGSLARVVVACDPVLASLQGGDIGANVSWDFVDQLLVPYIGTLTISSGTYVAATGTVTLTMSAPIGFDAGDGIVVSSLTGTGAFASLNGTFTAIAPTGGTTVTYQVPAPFPAASTITGGSLTLGSGASSLLPVKVLDVDVTNCETVVYSPINNAVTWNYNGSAALIQL